MFRNHLEFCVRTNRVSLEHALQNAPVNITRKTQASSLIDFLVRCCLHNIQILLVTLSLGRCHFIHKRSVCRYSLLDSLRIEALTVLDQVRCVSRKSGPKELQLFLPELPRSSGSYEEPADSVTKAASCAICERNQWRHWQSIKKHFFFAPTPTTSTTQLHGVRLRHCHHIQKNIFALKKSDSLTLT